MTPIISFINQKGGTGKTTLTVNVSYYLAQKDKKILLVDLDPQGHAAKCLGVYEYFKNSSIDLFLSKSSTPVECRENLWVLPSNKDIMENAFVFEGATLRKNLVGLSKKYGLDYIMIDSPPSMDNLTKSILFASDYVVVPVSVNYLALEGCAGLLKSIESTKTEHKINRPEIAAIVPTFYRNTKLAKDILATLRKHFEYLVTQTVIGFNVKIDEAQSFGKSVLEYAPGSKGALLIKNVAKEILNRIH